ncbi:hypothetical protein GQ457_09G026860 [Hibiscus cannabinus]
MVKTLSSPLNYKEAASAVLPWFHLTVLYQIDLFWLSCKAGPKTITILGEACLQPGFYWKKDCSGGLEIMRRYLFGTIAAL